MAAPLTPRAPAPGRWRRRVAGVALLLAVVLGHGWLAQRLIDARLGWGAAQRPPVRLEVAFVRELKPATPAPSPAARSTPSSRRLSSRPSEASPEKSASAAATPQPAARPAPLDVEPRAIEAPAPIAEGALASMPAPVAAAASGPASAFDWLPPSTQLSYTLVGEVNGPVHGHAQVRWIRAGDRYQVQIDTRVALVATRRLTSDGLLGPHGLSPRRYDEETEFVFTAPRRVNLRFEDAQVVLANGQAVLRPEGVQDTASQLVQLVWLFTTQPQRLAAGQRVVMPLALARRIDVWSYEVQPPQTVHTPFGAVEAFPVQPLRPPRTENVLTVQPWIAPSLQNLPVKLRIEQNERVYLELLLERAPMQAAPSP